MSHALYCSRPPAPSTKNRSVGYTFHVHLAHRCIAAQVVDRAASRFIASTTASMARVRQTRRMDLDLDEKGLGRLRRVADPRDVWLSESTDFTPWLAENLDVLAEAMRMSLTLTGREVPVGNFRLDIRAETQDGRVVVIENQLEPTDHGHLGQLLLYASGLESAVVVWVARQFREEFRRALDWLNERTDTGVDFFGVEVSVVEIGTGGPRAPVFDVVARPNNWQKIVKEGPPGSGPTRTANPLNAARQDFFVEILSDVTAQRPAIRVPSPGKLSWLNYASGPFGNWVVFVAADGRLKVDAYIDTGIREVNENLFDELAADSENWAQRIGLPLAWQRLDGKRACRISVSHEILDLTDPDARTAARTWATHAVVAMYDALDTTLRRRARELRAAANAAPS